jgi:hypothetical protein
MLYGKKYLLSHSQIFINTSTHTMSRVNSLLSKITVDLQEVSEENIDKEYPKSSYYRRA